MTTMQLRVQGMKAKTGSNHGLLIGYFSIKDEDVGSMVSGGRFADAVKIPVTVTSERERGLTDHYPDVTFVWLQLNVSITLQRNPLSPVGQIDIDSLERLSIKASEPSDGNLDWYLRPEDIELVDQFGHDNDPVRFRVDISGIAKITNESGSFNLDIVTVRGDTTLTIEQSAWEGILSRLGYSVPPSQYTLATQSTLLHESWKNAGAELELARNHLRLGEDRDAVTKCLDLFAAVVTAPYEKGSWKKYLTEVDEQKAEGLDRLFTGLATYFNKVGHHRSKAIRDDSGDLIVMDLDHWEADLVLDATQFILTYVLRLQAIGELVIPQNRPSGSDSQ